jgi:hypothetical protein
MAKNFVIRGNTAWLWTKASGWFYRGKKTKVTLEIYRQQSVV